MSQNAEQQLNKLRLYLSHLPDKLPPFQSLETSPYHGLLNFSIDEEFSRDCGLLTASFNRNLESTLAPSGRSADGTFVITERGQGIEALYDVIAFGVKAYGTDNFHVSLWLEGSIKSLENCYREHSVSLPLVPGPTLLPPPGPTPSSPPGPNAVTATAGPNVRSGLALPKRSRSETTVAKDSISTTAKKPKRVDTKKLDTYLDPEYDDLPEPTIDHKHGGRQTFPLLVKATRLCTRIDEPDSRFVRCLFSAQCKVSWHGKHRDKTRILKHLMNCGAAAIDVDGCRWADEAIDELSKDKPELKAQMHAKFDRIAGLSPADRAHLDGIVEDANNSHADNANNSSEADQTQSSSHSASTSGGAPDRLSRSDDSTVKSGKVIAFKQFQTTGHKDLQDKVDAKLVSFVVGDNLASNVLKSPHFIEFATALNAKYHPPSPTTFDDRLIPTYAAAVRKALIEFLMGERNIMLTFDGGKGKRHGMTSVCAITAHHIPFLLELDDSARLSHTTGYYKELLGKWIEKIGIYSIGALTSDEHAPCAKCRRELTEMYPHLLSFADACHNLSNTVKEIVKRVPSLESTVKRMRDILAFVSLSTYTFDQLDNERRRLGIGRTIEGIGETRFATMCWSAESLLRCYPAFVNIVRNPLLGIDNDMLHSTFDDECEGYYAFFERDLRRFVALLRPFAHAIQCLEARNTTPADVFVYWLAVNAQIAEMFDRAIGTAERRTAEVVRKVMNARWNRLINNPTSKNVYLLAFILTPANPNPAAVPTVTIQWSSLSDRLRGTGLPRVKAPTNIRDVVRRALQRMLKDEYSNVFESESLSVREAKQAMKRRNPLLAHRTPDEALSALRTQFSAYMDKASPFRQDQHPSETSLEYWHRHLRQDSDDADVLGALAIKIFSATPTSISDERVMSEVKIVNTDRQNRQSVSTINNRCLIRSAERLGQEKKVRV
ncbi:hypothetical protein FISHEDRAFT_56000 [Fistulina hepatica ATCC 64428]|uniref:DUF659 domain-containing protein n=1 Tax=Fistulina hepatica ATCC 64428 TaxID=1128425 RepID=A0A0D7AN88_9AGAR|nr:hypothetical protein FISHEDRAFT_56000 [Fistulina hepatica ATCC 64428]